MINIISTLMKALAHRSADKRGEKFQELQQARLRHLRMKKLRRQVKQSNKTQFVTCSNRNLSANGSNLWGCTSWSLCLTLDLFWKMRNLMTAKERAGAFWRLMSNRTLHCSKTFLKRDSEGQQLFLRERSRRNALNRRYGSSCRKSYRQRKIEKKDKKLSEQLNNLLRN